MMVKDEEKNIRRCLESLKPLIDSNIAELIIVDTGSCDKTAEIADEYTSKLYYHEWNNDFSAMRNITISYASGEWIFIIDADEVLEKPEELINLFSDDDLSKYNTVVLQIGNINSRKSKSDIAFNPSPRIFRNDGSFKYVGTVHNQPVFNSPLYYTDIAIKHYGYILSDRVLMDKKFKRTKTLLINELKKDPANIYYQYQLGVTYDMHGDTLKALEEFRKAYRLLKDMKKSEKASRIFVYGAYARCANNSKRYQEAIDVCKEGITLREEFIDFYYILGASFWAIGSINQAVNSFLKYIELVKNKNNLEISKDMSVIFYNIDEVSQSNACTLLCQCYADLGEYEKAEIYTEGIKDENSKTLLTVKILLNLGQFDRLKEFYINSLDSDSVKDISISCIEENIKTLDEKQRNKLREVFSSVGNTYGVFNRIKLLDGSEKEKAVDEFLKSVDFNNASIVYADILMDVLTDTERFFNILKEINTHKIREIEKYLIDKYPESYEVLKEYLIKSGIDSGSFDDNRLYIALTPVILIKHVEDYDEIQDDYYAIFKKYIKMGISYANRLYRLESGYPLLKSINDEEDKFFILMDYTNDCIASGDKKSAIKYMIEAVNTYKIFVKYIDKYKTEIFEQDSRKENNQEFEGYKLKVKKTISSLISKGFINEANEVISQYESIVKDDIEILLYKSQIALIESK